MDLLPTDRLHLTCVRGGGCCHAQKIPLTPWEIAKATVTFTPATTSTKALMLAPPRTRVTPRTASETGLLSPPSCRKGEPSSRPAPAAKKFPS